MSYNITLHCGCVVYVACDPRTGVPHTRIIEQRTPHCAVRKHEVGVRLAVWELLPDRLDRAAAALLRPHASTPSHPGGRLGERQRPVSGEKLAD